MVWKGDSTGRLAKGLITLIDQVDAQWPNRSRVSDGSIASSQHTVQNPTSDHERGADGIVEAIDITHDPDDNGPDTWKLAETFRINRDPRIKYVISNGRIFAGPDGPSPWLWRKYTGKNNHAQHVHVSIRKSLMDDTAPWKLTPGGSLIKPAPAPEPPKPKGITADMRQRMMKVIMGYEGKIPPRRFTAPDGRPEIAGVKQKDHPQAFAALNNLLEQGRDDELVAAVIAYYLEYTAQAQNWTDRAGVEFFLRDCILNRGPTGAAEILQDAIGVPVDGQVGPTTRGALAGFSPDAAIDRLRAARERYEDREYPHRRSSGQWQGMLNRWNKAQAQAKAFQKEQGTAGFDTGAATGVIVVGTGAAAAAKKDPWTIPDIAMAAFSIGVAAVVVFLIIRHFRRRS